MTEDNNRRWEDEQSIFLDEWPWTKGDITLIQGRRIAKATEAISTQLARNDQFRTISTLPDNTEVQDRVRDTLVHNFEQYIRSNDELSLAQTQAIENVSGSIQGVRDSIDSVGEGLSGVNDALDTVAENLDDLNETAGEILNGVYDVQQGIDRVDSRLGDIQDSLDYLADLTIEYIEEQIRTRKEIKKAIEKAVTVILTFLELHAKNLEKELRKVRLAQLSVKKSVDDVGGVAREISARVAENTAAQVRIAETTEATRARQYAQQGRKLYELGHVDEAVKRYNMAFDLDATDYETNYYLAKIAGMRGDETSLKRHLALAKSLATSKQEKVQIGQFAAGYSKIERKQPEVIANILEVLQNDPNAYYTKSIQDLLKGIDVGKEVLKPLSTGNNPDALALCAVECVRNPDYARVISLDVVVFVLVLHLQRKDLSPALRKKFLEEYVKPNSQKFMETVSGLKQWNTRGILKYAAIFLEVDKQVDVARKILVHTYKTDPEIREMKKQGNYAGIVEFFRATMGNEVAKLRRFGEIPKEIRRLI